MTQSRRVLAVACLTLLGFSASCVSSPKDADAQALVDSLAATHPDVTRLTIHAMPEGRSSYFAIASTFPAKQGAPSDPEDMQAMESGEIVKLLEESGLDVTVPIQMRDGKHREAVGVTISKSVASDAAVEQAKRIAAAIDRARTAKRAASRPAKR